MKKKEEVLKQELNERPEDKAAQEFQTYWPALNRGLHVLSKKALARVIKFTVGYPYEVDKLVFIDNTEKEMFFVLKHLIKQGTIMDIAALRQLSNNNDKKEKENESREKETV